MMEILEMEQGTPEWHALRKTKITATDAAVIMGVSPWKTKLQLYNEKISDDVKPLYMNPAMERGIELEPLARELFNIKTGWNMQPVIIVNDWLMASLDGRDEDSGTILEIKCPGVKDHALAESGKIPEYYLPQLQHQMYVSSVRLMYYYSFDGIEGVIVKVKRDDEYIEKMLVEEKKFYDCIINKTPPESSENDYILREDNEWKELSGRYYQLKEEIKFLLEEEENCRKELIALSGGSNSRGNGITLCQVERKGNIDYSKIPELKNVDVEQYRKEPINSWRITCS
jgi:putative phage-type endonuclease